MDTNPNKGTLTYFNHGSDTITWREAEVHLKWHGVIPPSTECENSSISISDGDYSTRNIVGYTQS